jgi:hypothetical protein
LAADLSWPDHRVTTVDRRYDPKYARDVVKIGETGIFSKPTRLFSFFWRRHHELFARKHHSRAICKPDYNFSLKLGIVPAARSVLIQQQKIFCRGLAQNRFQRAGILLRYQF